MSSSENELDSYSRNQVKRESLVTSKFNELESDFSSHKISNLTIQLDSYAEKEHEIISKGRNAKHNFHSKISNAKPNYLLCQRIKDPDLLLSLDNVVSSVCKNQPIYKETAYSSAFFHLTWCTFLLEGQFEIEKFPSSFQSLIPELSGFIPKKPIRFEGCDQFDGHLLYASACTHPDLEAFAQKLIDLVNIDGIIRTPGNREKFIPHVTLIQRNRTACKMFKSRWMNSELLAAFEDVYFGEQTVDCLEICKMGSINEDGFYNRIGSIPLTD